MSVTVPAPRPRVALALLTALTLMLIGLGTVAEAPADAAARSFHAHGSAGQVYALGLPAGARVTLLDNDGDKVQSRQVNSLGGVLFRHVDAGHGYRVRQDATGELSRTLTVHTNSPEQWNKKIYD